MNPPTQIHLCRAESGSTLVCAICTIFIISLIGANVLLNCTTRYNVTAKQVKAWKEALYAAESGGDTGFAEVRQKFNDPTFGPWTNSSAPFGQSSSLSTSVTVDKFYTDTDQIGYFRIRAAGTAKLLGLRRTGMDDRMDNTTRGDSLLRKIDFNYDHFRAKYGDGDGNNPTLQAVPNAQVTRLIELIAVPQQVSFTASLTASNSFNGPGSAGQVDSYDSKNRAYPRKSIAANPVPPTDPNYKYYI